ncbi:MAG: hypothetical protein BEN19_02250 [Epulopiscium sp. Nuni2H_MBin003]|nr:MAG: hypothetical protein BEN19_02250 [Epulopiscium sp. Nuni2H_MBin003]
MKKIRGTSYYSYRTRKISLKKNTIILTILISIFSAYFFMFYNGFNTPVEFIVEKEYAGDFVQSVISYDIHKATTNVKGLYVPAHKTSNMDELLEIVNTTEINSFVIDVKDDKGYLTFDSENLALLEVGSIKNNPPIDDINYLMDLLYKNDVYPIARIVVFKDTVVDTNFKDRMILDKNGEVYTNKADETWLDPSNTDNWTYILEFCKEAINVGFKEIQFDYIRFHESMNHETVILPEDETKTEIITRFVDYMVEQLSPYGVVISADVFGAIITSEIDSAIVGQDYQELAKRLDVICPMIYPSHYSTGSFGQVNPDLNPYEIILGALKASNEVIREIPIEERKAVVRPYLQDFTASWVTPHQEYTQVQIREQIDAVYDAILSEWIMWNGAANYTKEAFELY